MFHPLRFRRGGSTSATGRHVARETVEQTAGFRVEDQHALSRWFAIMREQHWSAWPAAARSPAV